MTSVAPLSTASCSTFTNSGRSDNLITSPPLPSWYSGITAMANWMSSSTRAFTDARTSEASRFGETSSSRTRARCRSAVSGARSSNSRSLKTR